MLIFSSPGWLFRLPVVLVGVPVEERDKRTYQLVI